MILRSITFSLVLLTFIFNSGVAFAETPEFKMAEDLMYVSLKDPLPDIESLNKQKIVSILRDVAAGKISRMGRTVVTPRRAQIALLRVGDDKSIEEAIAQFRGYNSRFAWAGLPKAMEWSHHPKLIPFLAEDFFRDENPNQYLKSKPQVGTTEATVVVPPRSVYAGTIAMHIIKRELAFSDELKEWAEKMISLRFSDVSKFRDTMRQWWKANKDHFEAEEYKKVKSFIERGKNQVEQDEPPKPRP